MANCERTTRVHIPDFHSSLQSLITEVVVRWTNIQKHVQNFSPERTSCALRDASKSNSTSGRGIHCTENCTSWYTGGDTSSDVSTRLGGRGRWGEKTYMNFKEGGQKNGCLVNNGGKKKCFICGIVSHNTDCLPRDFLFPENWLWSA